MKRIKIHISLLFSFAILWLVQLGPLSAQQQNEELPDASGSITISWSPAEDSEAGAIWYWVFTGADDAITRNRSATFTGLIAGEEYAWHVDAYSCVGDEEMPTCSLISDDPHASGIAIATGGRQGLKSGDRGDDDSSAPRRPRPIYVDHSVTVTGDAHFQPLTLDSIGYSDIIALGVISATDVWGTVPSGTRVCFVGHRGGGVMFKDSSITPHPKSWLEHFLIGDDTCADLPGAGTVVLVRQGGPYADASPLLEGLPQSICQIKLTETLFLRATPAGQIIGLVWLNSEVPVYVVEGHWYMVEFEGQVGYISRYYRKILRGNCG